MSTSTPNKEDFEYIINEAIILLELRSKSYVLYENNFDNDMDLITATLSAPKDVGDINPKQRDFLISSKASRKLQDIAIRAINSENLVDKVTVDEFIYDIRDSIYIHISNSGKFSPSGFASILSKATNRAKRKMKEVTYYFPMNALIPNLKKDINTGNVKIVGKDFIHNKVENDRNYDLFIKSNNSESYDSLLLITVPEASDKMSIKKANNIANFIYGVIKVFTTSYHSKAKQLNLMNNPSKSNITHYIKHHDDNYSIGGRLSFEENLNDFWNWFENELNSKLGIILKRLVDYALSPNDKDCLADRLIDSFYWFGDASRDNNESAQVIKLVTSMERLVTLPKANNQRITQNFVQRTSSIIAKYYSDVSKWSGYAERMYSMRSDLVHGSQSLYKSYHYSLGFNPFQPTYRAILSACTLFDEIGLEVSPYDKKLQILYSEVVRDYYHNKTSFIRIPFSYRKIKVKLNCNNYLTSTLRGTIVVSCSFERATGTQLKILSLNRNAVSK